MEVVKSQNSKLFKYILIIFAGSVLLTISAKIKIPFYPVPMTMQTFVVLFLGMSFGYKIGLATVSLYLLEGLLGMPVFSNSPEKGVGIIYFTGPTMGFLIGFLVIVFGDVTSTLAAGLASKMLNIDIAHVESGLRSGDITMPEDDSRDFKTAIKGQLTGVRNILKLIGIMALRYEKAGNLVNKKLWEKYEISEIDYLEMADLLGSDAYIMEEEHLFKDEQKETKSNILPIFRI